ncbi:MAG: CBASS cGAMP-activated phospholipase [Gammaproteobacteria bacterium]|nr:CBASS cGAMP-activated phospholipase [Gammaproteobacteria bacterium]
MSALSTSGEVQVQEVGTTENHAIRRTVSKPRTGGARRVLSIDGGGLKGVMPASFLAEIEGSTGLRIVDHFDLVVGTSTGGIIALGIGLRLPCEAIVNFYRQHGPRVFGQAHGGWLRSELGSHWRWCRGLVTNKHSGEPLRKALEDVFGQRRLGESSARLVIPTWDSLQRLPRLFKTAHHPRFQIDYKVSAVDIAMATAAAPTYLPAYRLRGVEHVDGGIWANNPTTVAAVEAIATLGWHADDVTMLSLGCSDERLVVPSKLGRLRGAGLGSEMMLQAQSHAALWTTKVLLGGGTANHERLSRVDLVVERGFANMDDAKQMSQFEGLGRTQARDWLPRIQDKFLAGPKQAFVPCHSLPANRS